MNCRGENVHNKQTHLEQSLLAFNNGANFCIWLTLIFCSDQEAWLAHGLLCSENRVSERATQVSGLTTKN